MDIEEKIIKIKEYIGECDSIKELCEKIGVRASGASHTLVKRIIEENNLDISHFGGRSRVRDERNKNNYKRKHVSEIFIENSNYSTASLKKRMLREKLRENKCENCGITSWEGKDISFEVHHINGISNDHRLDNLILLCPNCHSQTHNYRGKNKTNSYELSFKLKKIAEVESKNYILPEKPKPKKREIIIKEKRYCSFCEKELTGKSYRNKFCSIECYRTSTCDNIPPVFELIDKFKTLGNFSAVGRYYNVTDNTVKKWCVRYKIMDLIKN